MVDQLRESKCMKKSEGICCCECRWLALDLSHPEIDGKPLSNVKGRVCLAPEFYTSEGVPEVISGWWEHGLCEMFDQRLRGCE